MAKPKIKFVPDSLPRVKSVPNKLHVKTGDIVYVISGKDKKKTGKVLKVFPKKGKIIVEGINIVTKHLKPSQVNPQGGVVQKEAAIFSSKVMLFDEKTKKQVTPRFEPITSEYLEYDEVMEKFDQMQEYVAKTYMNALNIIHYMHDKYAYESIEMALHDRDILRTMACGIAGLSVVADALSAMKYAKVKTIRDEDRNSCRL